MPIKVSDDLVLYDVEEMAKLFGLSEKSVRLLFKAGRLKGRKMAKKWYVTEAELKSYFSQAEPLSEPEGLETEQEQQHEPAKSL